MLTRALSQLLVAFTIEFDDAFEARMPHRTARGPAAGSGSGPSSSPWLISRAMWTNFLRWVPEDGLLDPRPLAAVTNLAGLLRWRYLRDEGDRVMLTDNGIAANRVWATLTEEIEERWRSRFGSARIEALRAALRPGVDASLPWALPVVGVVSTSTRLAGWSSAIRGADDELPTLLARALMGLARDMESRSEVPVHLALNALRVADGARPRDLPSLAGISREAASLSLAGLERQGLLHRGTTVELTETGRRARDAQPAIREVAEEAWDPAVLDAAEAVRTQTDALSAGLRPHADGWRAHPPYLAQTRRMLADPGAALPWFPMVLHRGGYPDGS